MSRAKYVVVALVAVALVAGCTAQKQEQAQTQPAPQQQPATQPPASQPSPTPATPEAPPVQPAANPQAPAAQPARAPVAQSRPQAPRPAIAPPVEPAAPARTEPATAPGPAQAGGNAATPTPVAPPKPVFALVPSGTRLQVRLEDSLSSAENKDGDGFTATLDAAVEVDGIVVAPRGSTVKGKVISATRSGKVKGRANMALALMEIKVKDASYPIRTHTLSFEAQGTEKEDALKVGGGAGLGAIIGAIAGGGKGAAIGAVVGGGAGTATVMATRGKEVKFSPEQKFSFVLRDDLQIRMR